MDAGTLENLLQAIKPCVDSDKVQWKSLPKMYEVARDMTYLQNLVPWCVRSYVHPFETLCLNLGLYWRIEHTPRLTFRPVRYILH